MLGQVRRTQRYTSRVADDEAALTANIVSLASDEYGRYGYRRITALLRADGWRVERIWRQEGLKVPARHPKRGRLWLSDQFLYQAQTGVWQPRVGVRLRI